MDTIDSAEYAARLRLLKNFLGILTHPDRRKVDGLNPDELRASIRSLYQSMPLGCRDLLQYARAGQSSIVVAQGADGKWRYSFRP